jgi:hypothetical protein
MTALLVTALLPAHAVVLRFRPEIGATHRYKVTMSGRTNTEMMGHAISVQTTGTIDYAEKALSREDDVTRYEKQQLGGSIELTQGGQSQTMDLPGGRSVVDVDSRGRVVEIVEAESEGETDEQPLMGFGPESMVTSSHYGSFPEGDVKKGDTWSDTISVPWAPGGSEVDVTCSVELLALTTFQSRKCAKIRISFDGPVEMDLTELGMPAGEEGPATMEGVLKGDLLTYYDYENSLYVYSEGTVGMDAQISMSGMPGGAMEMKTIMNLKMAMVE